MTSTAPSNLKRCTNCDRELELDEFPQDRGRLYSKCKACKRASVANHRSAHAITRKPEDRVSEIPDEWSDRHEVVTQLAHQLRAWLLQTKALEHDLDVLRRELRTGRFVNLPDLELQVAHAHLQLQALNHEVAGALQGYILLADHLRRTQQQEGGGQ